MLTPNLVLPIVNRTSNDLRIMLEPEGDMITLSSGKEFQIVIGNDLRDGEVALEVHEDMLSIHAMAVKAVYQDGTQVR